MADEAATFDVAVIGAGVNGAGIARDAALRGLSVIVFDKEDTCTATSAWSSRLIHGGLRYLEYAEFPLVFESLRERITLRRNAGHLVKPIRISIPIYESAKRGPLLIRIGMILYDLLSVGKTVPRHDMLSRRQATESFPGLRAEGLRAVARYFDAQVRYAERLVLENLIGAHAAGADIRTHTAVTRIDIDDGSVSGVAFRDLLTGEEGAVAARVVINAGGPWVDSVLQTTGRPPAKRFIGGTKGSHIIVGRFDGAPEDAFYVEAQSDGRPFFIIPWNGQYLIGTTDIRYDGSLDEVRASAEEVDYLLSETNRVFPNAKLAKEHIHYAYAAVRPLPHQEKGPESAITRRHIIKHNKKIARGLFSIIGGKLTTYRNLAEQVVDRLPRVLGRKLPECRTGATKLPGAYRLDEAQQRLLSTSSVNPNAAARLIDVYGGRAIDLLELAEAEEGLMEWLDDARTVLAAEVAFALRVELARTLCDVVFRRMMIGLDADQGRPLYDAIAAVAAREAGWDDEEKARELRALCDYSDSFGV